MHLYNEFETSKKYRFPSSHCKKWYSTSSLIISADWTNADGEGWTVPFGCGLGCMFRLAKQPMQIFIEGYYNAIRPSFMGEELLYDWTIRTQLQVLFPR